MIQIVNTSTKAIEVFKHEIQSRLSERNFNRIEPGNSIDIQINKDEWVEIYNCEDME